MQVGITPVEPADTAMITDAETMRLSPAGVASRRFDLLLENGTNRPISREFSPP